MISFKLGFVPCAYRYYISITFEPLIFDSFATNSLGTKLASNEHRENILQARLISPPLLHDLDPISVGVEYECDLFHGSLMQLLLKLNSKSFKSLTRLNQIRHEDADVAEAFVLSFISAAVFEVEIEFSAPIMAQFQQALLGPHPVT